MMAAVVALMVVWQGSRSADIKTVMIAEVFKHGAAVNYSRLAERDPILDINTFGQSLPNGIRQQYVLGTMVADQYPQLFSNLNLSQLKMTSSSPTFCIESAQSHLMGLLQHVEPPKITIDAHNLDKIYPPMKEFKANMNLSSSDYPMLQKDSFFAMSPISVFGSSKDYVFFPCIETQCPHVREENEFHYTRFISQEKNAFNDFYAFLENHGLSSNAWYKSPKWTIDLVSNMYTYSEVYKATFGRLPPKVTPDILQESRMIHMIYTLNYYLPTPDVAKVYTSNLMKLVMDSLKQGQKQEVKYAGFSSQNHTLLALLATLQVISPECYLNYYKKKIFYFSDPTCVDFPEFSSNLIFELNSNKQLNYGETEESEQTNYFISVVYDGKPLEIPECSKKSLCTWEEFSRIVALQMRVESVEIRCGIGKRLKTTYFWIIMSCIIVGTLVMAGLALKSRIIHWKKMKNVNRLSDDFLRSSIT